MTKNKCGNKVLLSGNHPHAGKIGIYIGTISTIMGLAGLIRFDDGTEVCIFKSEEIRFIQ